MALGVARVTVDHRIPERMTLHLALDVKVIPRKFGPGAKPFKINVDKSPVPFANTTGDHDKR
jgi:hypothetical protein